MKKNNSWIQYIDLSKQFNEEKKLLLPKIEKLLLPENILIDELKSLKMKFVNIKI